MYINLVEKYKIKQTFSLDRSSHSKNKLLEIVLTL